MVIVEDASEVVDWSDAVLEKALLDIVRRPFVDPFKVLELVTDATFKLCAEVSIEVLGSRVAEPA